MLGALPYALLLSGMSSKLSGARIPGLTLTLPTHYTMEDTFSADRHRERGSRVVES